MTRRPLTAPLLYWLLVIAGLVGMTVVRLGDPRGGSTLESEILPIWVGTIAGVGIGQLLSSLRVRPWVPLGLSFVGLWFTPIVYYALYFYFRDQIGNAMEPGVAALLPSAICGYLALSERAALVAFWYPAMLWMLPILDGHGRSSWDRASAPLAVALAVLFVAFLRARETRRVAIWQAQGDARIAPVRERKVLRTSPARTTAGHVWTVSVGAAALVLAAWVAPHLWRKDAASERPSATATSAAGPLEETEVDEATGQPCCPAERFDDPSRSRVREYFDLRASRDEQRRTSMLSLCTRCGGYSAETAATSGGSASYATSYSSVSGTSAASLDSSNATSTVPQAAYAPPTTNEPPAPPPVIAPPARHEATPIEPPKPRVAGAGSPRSIKSTAPGAGASTHGGAPAGFGSPAATPVATATATSIDLGAPWRWTLALVLGGVFGHVLTRALRRWITLRHLARPFWRETVDQQISNHWQRLLIGLRDAGIHPAKDEQPLAFARRLGLEGLETCATILERARHGVRIEADDLATMDAAATAVYRSARATAGASARAWAWLRWPLA